MKGRHKPVFDSGRREIERYVCAVLLYLHMPLCLAVAHNNILKNDTSSGGDRLLCSLQRQKKKIGSFAVMCERKNKNIRATVLWSVKDTIGRKINLHKNATCIPSLRM